MNISGYLLTFALYLVLLAPSGAEVVGRNCTESPDCGSYAFCGNVKTCECLPNYIEVNKYCQPSTTVNPDRVVCSTNADCNARWPGAICYSNNPNLANINGVCRCVNNQYPIRSSDSRLICDFDGSEARCPSGRPLKTGDGLTDQTCSTNSACPNDYECTTTTKTSTNTQVRVCCPTRQKSCTDQLDQGAPCALTTATITRYYYNQAKGTCQEFFFSGCQGNGNNFATYNECASYCSAYAGTVQKPTCSQGTPATDSSGNYINCGINGVANDALCPTFGLNYRCTSNGVAYGCCPTQAYNCMVPYDRGTLCGSSSSVTRWYYNSATGSCQTFNFNGCDGNGNNFPSQSTCTQFCGNPCGDGYTTVQPDSCNPSTANTCPAGSVCRAPPGQINYFCCAAPILAAINDASATTSTSCPPATTPQLSKGNQVTRCSPSQNTCGQNAMCSYVSSYSGFVCCVSVSVNVGISSLLFPAPTANQAFSTGRDCIASLAYNYPGTTLPLACTPSGTPCPTGYTCQASNSGGMVCCSNIPISSANAPAAAIRCVRGAPYAYLGGTMPLSCTPGSACPTGYACGASSNPSTFLCCSI